MKKDSGNPYIGLRPFDVDESILFFGRNDQSLELLQRLHQHHFVAVVGSSGSGKSSLLRAGLIPALKAGYLIDDSDDWFISIMKPGLSPLYNLSESVLFQTEPGHTKNDIADLLQQIKEQGADALLQRILPVIKEKKNNFFLLVDQFEELFRFAMNQEDTNKKDEAIDFVNIMLELTQQREIPFYVVLTMRSDFIGDCAQFYGLPEAMNQSQYLVPRLSRMQLKTVIESPALLYGSKVDPVLTSKLLNDLGKVKDELPLLQHALMRIWDFEMSVNRSGMVDMEDYESIGGIEKALSNHADEALNGMSEDDLFLTKKIFQALTTTDDNGRKIRRQVLMSKLIELTGAAEPKLLEIIQLFIKDKRSFLIISPAGETGDKIIDISHESLIRQWDMLGKWVDEEAESTAIYLQLAESAGLYQKKKKDFLSGSELQLALEWNKTFKPVAAWADRYSKGFDFNIGYLLASEKDRLDKQQKERSSKQKQVFLSIGLTALFLVVLVVIFAVIWLVSLNKDLDSAKVASQGYSLYLNAYIQEDIDPTLALRLAEESILKNQDSTTADYAQKLYHENSFFRIISQQDTAISYMAISKDGKKIVVAVAGNKAVMCDAAGNILQEFKGHTGEIYDVTFSPDDKTLLTASGDSTVRLWDMKGNTLKVFTGHTNQVFAATFSPDGKKILTGGNDNTVRLWDIATGKQLAAPFRGHVAAVSSVCFSPDGKYIASASFDSSAILWDTGGRGIIQFRGHSTSIMAVTFSPDGKKLLTGSLDGTAILWNMDAEIEQRTVAGDGIYGVAFSPDGRSFMTASGDNHAYLWNLDGVLLQRFISTKENEEYGMLSVAYTPDGGSVITASTDGSLRTWDIKSQVLQEFYNTSNAVKAIAFSPDGKFVLTNYGFNKARLWDLKGNVIRQFEMAPMEVTAVAYAPVGEIIAIGYANGDIQLWPKDGSPTKSFKNSNKKINALAISPDGSSMLAAYEDSVGRIWDMKSSGYIELKGHRKVITSVAFSKDGKNMITGSMDSTVIEWNVLGTKLNKFKNEMASVKAVALSPDGEYILTGSASDNKARLLGKDGKVIREITGHGMSITSVAFSPDGKYILTGSNDKSATIWDLKGKIVQDMNLHRGEVLAVAFSPDGKNILTGSADKHAFLWKRIMPLSEFLKTNKLQPLSQEQREFYGIN